MSMQHDARYLRKTSLAGPNRAVDLAPQAKLVPRDERTNELTSGQSGRIRDGSRRYVPGAKKWYYGYNVKGQEDPLAEDFPVGLRHRRAVCVWLTVAVCAIMAIVTTVLVALTISHLDMDEYGLRGAVVGETAVRFLKPFEVTGRTLLAGSQTLLRALDGNAFVVAAQAIVLSALSATGRLSSRMEMGNDSVLFGGSRFTVKEGVLAEPWVVFEPDVTRLSARRTEISGTLIVENGTQLTTRQITAGAAPLQVLSDTTIDMIGFGDARLTSRLANLNVNAPNGNIVVNGSTGGFGLSTTLQAGLGNLQLPVGVRLPPVPAGAAWTLCVCGNGGVYAVPGDMTCSDAAAVDPARCS